MNHQYKNSFLLMWHVLLGGAFALYTFFLINGYDRNVILGSVISISILVTYLMILNYSADAFNKEEIGWAYFLTIAGFFIAVFIQAITCANSINFQNMH